jgi:hypothetical protein
VKIPLNRVVAFAGPYVSLIAGGVAAWLVAKANVLGVPGLDQANTATWIAGALTLALTAVLSQVGQSSWLKGHHIELEGTALVQAAALTPAPAPAQLVAGAPLEPPLGPAELAPEGLGEGDDLDTTEHELLTGALEGSDVSDEEEFGAGYGPESRETPDRPGS